MKRLLITIPCYNEELVLEKTVNEMMAYANINLSKYDWTMLIIDNNSHDHTVDIAKNICHAFPTKVLLEQVPSPGRGAALREAWARVSGFDIYAYVDADLATDLKDFKPLVDYVAAGDDCVVGSRYISASNVERSWDRLLFSKTYNFLLKHYLGVSFTDAQCGFKAFSGRLVADIIPQTTDSGWFFDTELIILALRQGYSYREIPVTWREVRDELRRSKVNPWQEAVLQLKNIHQMKKRLASAHEIDPSPNV